MPNTTTNHAITCTNIMTFGFLVKLQMQRTH